MDGDALSDFSVLNEVLVIPKRWVDCEKVVEDMT